MSGVAQYRAAIEEKKVLTKIIVGYWPRRHMSSTSWLHYLLGMQLAAFECDELDLADELDLLVRVAKEIEFPNLPAPA